MNQKQMMIFVFVLFTVVGGAAFLITANQSNIYQDLMASAPQDLQDVRFYKDFLRDDGDLDLPFGDPALIAMLHQNLLGITTSNATLKSLEIVKDVKIRLTLAGDNPRILQFTFYHTVELGEKMIISLEEVHGDVYSNAGTYESDTFYAWLSGMASTRRYQEIWSW